ncbi:peptide deformylase [Paraburkholderia ultramafica]|uniref:peptide deformylase n=1 Tax=Paraburkholderia ultramafica TaxID=1544867 RepID=UPI002483FBC2|nr:peptide deformylase [Paraburkholderia ultramafica]
MAVLTILKYPDERLETKAAPVLRVDDRIQHLAHDMAQTMYSALPAALGWRHRK